MKMFSNLISNPISKPISIPISNPNVASPSDNLISLSYSMPVFSANFFGLFELVLNGSKMFAMDTDRPRQTWMDPDGPRCIGALLPAIYKKYFNSTLFSKVPSMLLVNVCIYILCRLLPT